jgi:hypothetical protein
MVQEIQGTNRGQGLQDIIDTKPSTPEVKPEEQAEQPKPKYQLPAGKEANVALAPSAHGKALPEGVTNIGRHAVHIPDKQAQLDGFYAEHAGVLVAQFPQYKFAQKKGEKNAQTIKL